MRAYKYDLATGTILEGGYTEPFNVDTTTQGVVHIDDDVTPHPDPRTKRVQDGAIRDATTEEIEAFDAAQFQAAVAASVGQNPLIAALGLTLETRRVGHELTPEEQQGLLTEVSIRYRALRGQG